MKQIARSSCDCEDCEHRRAAEQMRVFWQSREGRANVKRTRRYVTRTKPVRK